jgi:hypothetical protein
MSHPIQLERTYSPEVKTKAKLLLEIFGENPYHAQARTVGGEITYAPVKQPLTEEIIQNHLDGKIILGAYQLSQKNEVNFIAWDIDSVDRSIARKHAEQIISKLKDFPYAVEVSGGKGYHIFIFLSEPMPADRAKQIAEFVRDSSGIPKIGASHVEAFPKQKALSKTTPYGNLIKIPLGLHPKTHNQSKFIDYENGWEAGEALDPIVILQHRVAPEELDKLFSSGEKDVRKLITELVAPYWIGGERHNLSLYLSGYLAHLGWGMQASEDLIREIAIAAGDTDHVNRVQAVKDTFRSISEGKTVKGYSGLNELLPGAALRSLSEYASKIMTPTLVKQIDSIRLQKGAGFEKIRSVSTVIWMNLQESGELVQTTDGSCYWYSCSDHLLTDLNSVKWQAILYTDYGINPAESFGKQVTEALRLRAVIEAKLVTVQNRSLWTEDSLFVNLGGSIVYILDGKDIKTAYNGECGYMFRTDSSMIDPIEPDFSSETDAWEKLVNDVSFLKSSDAPASPQEQQELLKAWILAFFFQELMPTKPLLLAMGAPGSGKTTAIRRILKVLETPDAEVLEIAGDKPDSLRASISSHKLLALDNLEKSDARWLVDALNRLATGANIELRQLYKTNETYVLKPNCFVAMTAVSMPFSEETLFSRILPLEMQQLSSPLPEYFLQKQLVENMDGIWGDLLKKLNKVVNALQKDKSHIPPIASRLADFTVFCKRIEDSGVVSGEILLHGLRSLVDRQRMALMEASPFIFILEQWLESGDSEIGKYHTFQQLFSILEPLAHSRKLEWRWANSSALERHITVLSKQLTKLYNADFKEFTESSGKAITKLKFIA